MTSTFWDSPSSGPPSGRPRVLVADDHEAMLDHLVRLLSRDFDVVATVRDGAAAVREAPRLNPDILVLDIAMPKLSGIEAAGRLKANGSTAKVVFVTMHQDREFVAGAAALGSVGFVAKNRLVSDLIPAIHSVLAGQPFVSPSVPA
jgi:DNA-binding NarL/FixJ family response regulator